MKPLKITFEYDEEKTNALEFMLKRKNSNVEKEVVSFMDKLYDKVVPDIIKEMVDDRNNFNCNKQKKEKKSDIEIISTK